MNSSVHFIPPAHRKLRGFTLIELLVVILILGILMVIAVPTYNGAVSDAQHRTCRANMQTIANAEQAYRTRTAARVYTNDLTSASPLLTDLGGIPKCPQGGTYSVTDVAGTALTAASTAFTVHCSYSSVAGCITPAGVCPAPAHDAPYVVGETNGYTLNVNTQ